MEEQKEQVLDKVATFEEMKESIEQTINNLKILTEQQGDLLKLVEENNKDKKYDQFILDMKSEIKNYQGQLVTLTTRLSIIKNILDFIKRDENAKTFFLDILDAFGIFNR